MEDVQPIRLQLTSDMLEVIAQHMMDRVGDKYEVHEIYGHYGLETLYLKPIGQTTFVAKGVHLDGEANEVFYIAIDERNTITDIEPTPEMQRADYRGGFGMTPDQIIDIWFPEINDPNAALHVPMLPLAA